MVLPTTIKVKRSSTNVIPTLQFGEMALSSIPSGTTGQPATSQFFIGDYNSTPVLLSTSNMFSSPNFTGSPTANTPTTGDNSTKLATTAFVKTAVSSATTYTSGNGIAISNNIITAVPDNSNIIFNSSGQLTTASVIDGGTY